MKLLIIGSEGFIGNHCASYFKQKGHEIIGCDLLNTKPSYKYFQISRFTPDYEEVFKSTRYDVCINAAGNGSVPVSIEHPLMDFEANVYDTVRVLEQIRTLQPTCKFVYFSSAAVYGNPTLPVLESNEINPISPYGWHKYHAEQVCKEYHYLYGIPTVILRPFSVYGPNLRKQLVWDLFHKFKTSEKVEIYGTGEESRDFIYIQDLVTSLDVLLQKDELNGKSFNIASGKEVFIREIVTLIAHNLGRPSDSYYFNGISRPGDPLNWVADISKLSTYGFSPSISLENGIVETIKWLEQQK